MTDPASLSDADLAATYLRAAGTREAMNWQPNMVDAGSTSRPTSTRGGSLTADDLGNFA